MASEGRMKLLASLKSSILIAEGLVIAGKSKLQAAQIESDLRRERKKRENKQLYNLVHPYPFGRNNPKPI
jgi:hypothetical protein